MTDTLQLNNTLEGGCPPATCSPSSELLENLEEWGEHFREKQHGVTLTILRARKTISDQSARIAWLENQWEETKELLHAVGAGRVDSRLRRNVEEALMHLETNYDIDGASMKDSDAARKLRAAISLENADSHSAALTDAQPKQ